MSENIIAEIAELRNRIDLLVSTVASLQSVVATLQEKPKRQKARIIQDVVPFEAKGENELQRKIYASLRRKPISTAVIANRIKVDEKQVKQTVIDMENSGIIKKSNGQRVYRGNQVIVWSART